MQLHSKLAHLSAEQITDLLEKYDDHSIALKDIISEFSIQTTPSALKALLPPLVHEGLTCTHCEDVFLQSRRTRRLRDVSSIGRCPKCGHQNTNACRCMKCREAAVRDRLRTDQIKRSIIQKNYAGFLWTGDVLNLTLRDAVFLSALIRHSLSEDMATVEPFSDRPPALAPNGDYTMEIVKHLRSKTMLAIDPESSIEAFLFDAELKSAHSYYPAKVS